MNNAVVKNYIFEDGFCLFVINYVGYDYVDKDILRFVKEHGKVMSYIVNYECEVVIDEI